MGPTAEEYEEALRKIELARPQHLRDFNGLLLHDARVYSMARQGDQFIMVLKKDIPPTTGSTGSFDHIALNATGWAEMKAKLRRLKIPYEEQLVDDNAALQIFFRDTNGLRIELDYKLDEAGA